MFVCGSGEHTWSDKASADKCCNGHRCELRVGGPLPSDDPAGMVYIGYGLVYVFVPIRNISVIH